MPFTSEAAYSDQPPPPPYDEPVDIVRPIRTVHDETFRGVWYRHLSIASMAHLPHLIGHVEHHNPATDGSFSICIAGGEGIFISQGLYNSIPEEQRPALDASVAGDKIDLPLAGGSMTAAGSTYFPFILTTNMNERVRLVLLAYVLPDLSMGMFISQGGNSSLEISSVWRGGIGPSFLFDFKTEKCWFDGLGQHQ